MRIVLFGPRKRIGALVGDKIIDLNGANPGLPAELAQFIEGGGAVLDAVKRTLDKPPQDAVFDAKGVRLHAPWARKRIAMAGGNYAEHLAGMTANHRGTPLMGDSIQAAYRSAREKGQWGFWKVLDEMAGPDDEIPYPHNRTKYLDFEGEVAIVIGKRGKNIRASQIADYVWGITLANDWSIRDNVSPSGGTSYNFSKNFDLSCSMGPCIVVGEAECQNVDVETKVNGQVRQHYNSGAMIFSFGEILEFLSRDFTFVPGDVISGGTSVGTAADQTKRAPDGTRPVDLFLKPGDVVELSSPQIGSIRNEII